ncbi:hypothetical protein [Paludisphaera mucosa]|uniref:Uncharacterized protein n=1 Tax=Paludisphaera mucosa TaxID=3030827 RepID=A0ABT6FJ60_9BACT|nr:hypothetical protein [Paludisphaera mucosa]MDG3007617.1 hypothetical protein [Paludisphaera mucosa]
MKCNNGLLLIIVGAVLVLSPIFLHAISNAQDKERIERFYNSNSNHVVLPNALEPTDFGGSHWACLGLGAALTFIGVGRSRPVSTAKPTSWATAEV